jgi:hypothetical protein
MLARAITGTECEQLEHVLGNACFPMHGTQLNPNVVAVNSFGIERLRTCRLDTHSIPIGRHGRYPTLDNVIERIGQASENSMAAG